MKYEVIVCNICGKEIKDKRKNIFEQYIVDVDEKIDICSEICLKTYMGCVMHKMQLNDNFFYWCCDCILEEWSEITRWKYKIKKFYDSNIHIYSKDTLIRYLLDQYKEKIVKFGTIDN